MSEPTKRDEERAQAGKLIYSIFGAQDIRHDDRWGRLQGGIAALIAAVREEGRREERERIEEAINKTFKLRPVGISAWNAALDEILRRVRKGGA